jgi:hypothetical protein
MNIKKLIVYKSPILIEILEEIKEYLNFEIITFEKVTNNLEKLDDFIIVSLKNNDIKNCNLISVPSKIEKILEQINILFLGNNFNNQSSILIGKYNLDLNSRKISLNETVLDLTEKEARLLMYIKNNNNVSLKDLQKEVWQHSFELETHTVETHIYRLRKKFIEKFNDNNLIKYDKKGYYII